MLTLALPVFLALALLAATLLGYITPAQCAAGLGLLLAPGANSYAPLLREILGGQAKPPRRLAVDFDQAAADAYTAYGTAAGWLTVSGSPMPSWGEQSPRLKALWVEAARGAHGEPPGVAPGSLAPSRPPAPSAPPKPSAPRPGDLERRQDELGVCTLQRVST